MIKRPEILAPAGNLECFIAAVNSGADAIYTGGMKFGARAFAGNFDEEELKEALHFAHLHDVKVYLTVNTLIKNNELYKEFYDYFAPFYEEGIDAVIIQDLGLMSFVNKYFPKAAIHASTQSALFTHYSANKLHQLYNITRVVPPRELSIEEIIKYKNNTDLELEVFTHGALCYCYSGRCLMSSDSGGRSGNRGRCAQPCRYSYQAINTTKPAKGYLLSPKDMCTLSILDELMEAGIDSFKIEGRMKKPEYVALCTGIYKEYALRYEKLGAKEYKKWVRDNEKKLKEDITCLSDIYNRGGFNKGYFHVHNGKEMMSFLRPNHFGTYVGKVTHTEKGNCMITAIKDINAHDVLQIRNKKEEVIYEFTTGSNTHCGQKFKTKVYNKLNVSLNQPVYRIRNTALIEKTLNAIKQDEKIPVSIIFNAHNEEPLKISITGRGVCVNYESGTAINALNNPVSSQKTAAQLGKLGNTPFYSEDIKVNMEEDLFFPMSALNDLRRKGIEKLLNEINAKSKRIIDNTQEPAMPEITINNNQNISSLHVICEDFTQCSIICGINEVKYVHFNLRNDNDYNSSMVKLIKAAKKIPVIILPAVIRYDYFNKVSELIKNFSDENVHIMSDNLEGILIALSLGYLKNQIISGAGLYTFNNSSCEMMKELCDINVLPYELNKDEMSCMNNAANGVMVYGRIPLMVSAGCVNRNLGKCDRKEKVLKLECENKKTFEVYNHCDWCYNVITRGQCFSLIDKLTFLSEMGIKHFIIDLTHQAPGNYGKINEICKKITPNSDFLKSFEKNICNNTYSGYYNSGVE